MDAKSLIESLIRTLMCLAGILGNNWLAVCSLPRKKSGIRTNEVLFINLAVSNLITNYLVDLPDTLVDFSERWFLGETYCGMFHFFADLSETSSIYTTFFISVFWHQKLVGSLRRGGASVQLDSLCLVACLLAGSWTLAMVFSIPHLFFFTVEGANGSNEECVDTFPNALAKQTYEIFYLTLANAIPVAGSVFASFQIVITLLQNQRRIQGHNSNPDKVMVQDENKSGEKRSYDRSVSIISVPGGSQHLKDSASLTSIYIGVPSSSACPNTINRATITDSKVGAPPKLSMPRQMPAKLSSSSSTQARAAKSVVAVASVFLVCWMTHLLLRISSNIHTSSLLVEVASYIAASYTSIIPYIFLYGVKKLSCSCKR